MVEVVTSPTQMITNLLWKMLLNVKRMILSAVDWKLLVYLNCGSAGSLPINLCCADCIIQLRPADALLLN